MVQRTLTGKPFQAHLPHKCRFCDGAFATAQGLAGYLLHRHRGLSCVSAPGMLISQLLLCSGSQSASQEQIPEQEEAVPVDVATADEDHTLSTNCSEGI